MNRLGNLNLANKANGQASGSRSWTPLISARIERATPTLVELTFNKSLDESIIPTLSLAGKTITNVDVSGSVITLTVSAAYAYGTSVIANYVKSGINKIRSITGRLSNSFSKAVVFNTSDLTELLSDTTLIKSDII